ncbi:PAS domain-containing hybrid sensor histidine kinase/response regulator [Oceanicola sp. 22II-s10i]|uniref:hybrid sensor histidine kinase/response regulator n=1 Tax=Oceanicola sp. 22II-s10i TaxID=1317116 RepID=UPI001595AC87|nr:PAS domain-containing hybrid sensor histidine kinase/response regulator [Oceanicola sp. 22II-s10i]
MLVLGVFSVLCLIVVVYLSTEVRQNLRQLSDSPNDNMQWTLSQLEVEFLELALAVDRAVSAAPDSATSALAELRKRYDILYSRFDTLTSSPLYFSVLQSNELGGRFMELAGTIRDLVPLIDSSDTALTAGLPGLRSSLGLLRQDMRAILTIGNQGLVRQSDASRRGVAAVLQRLAIAAFVLLIALSLLVLMFRHLAGAHERRAREVLATSSRLATIVSTSRDALLLIDRRGHIELANEAASIMFGQPRDTLMGQRIGTVLLHPEATGRPVTAHDLRMFCEGRVNVPHRLIGCSAAGARFPVELSLDMTDRRGQQACVCVIRDVSHQVETEAVLKQSRDTALAGERAKARFLGVVSHEMRTPLNGILGTVDLMRDANESEIRERYLPVLDHSGRLLLDLVNDVLDITRIEGGAPVRTGPFDLDDLIQSVIDAERPRARGNRNRLSRPAESAVGAVTGDARRVRQILLNLVSNAVKFTEGGEVTISAERTGRDRVEISVADTGIGIPSADLKKIFDDFVRLDSALDRQVQGTGLGLGIARQLARGMGGDIVADSIEGEGSLFHLTLPLPAAQSAPVAKTGGADFRVQAPKQARAGSPLNVLLVEDNATNRFVAGRMLQRLGHRVTEAHDGAEAVEIAAHTAFDLIVMDVSMPVMDGVEATRTIRAGFGPNRSARIVALTAHVDEAVDISLREAGVDEIASKPMTSADLSRVLSGQHDPVSPRDEPPPAGDVPSLPILDPAATGSAFLSSAARRTLIDRFIAEGDDLLGPDRIAAPPEEPFRASPATADALHAFSGAAATVGARRLHAVLVQAEQAARQGQPRSLRGHLREARDVWLATRACLIAIPLEHPRTDPPPIPADPAERRA